MFDHRAILCSIRVINSRCDILLDRSVVTHGFSRCGHNKLQYTVFCLLTVYFYLYLYLKLFGSFQSLPLWRQHFSCGCHLPSASSLLCTALCSLCIVWIRYRHVSASWSLCREMTRTRRAEMIYYVTLSPRGSWTQSVGSGGREVERRTVNRGEGGSIPPAAVSKLRQFLHPTFACVFRKRH